MNSDLINFISEAVALNTLYGNRPFSLRRKAELTGFASIKSSTFLFGGKFCYSKEQSSSCWRIFSKFKSGFFSYASIIFLSFLGDVSRYPISVSSKEPSQSDKSLLTFDSVSSDYPQYII